MVSNEKLKQLGFELTKYSETSGYWVYENTRDDQRVCISFDGQDWYITSETISTEKDWYGNQRTMPLGLKYEEVQAFIALIDGLKVPLPINAL